MPEIIHSHLTHIVWAAVCLLVALVVHFWPILKTWLAARAAAAAAEEKRVKAAVELVAGNAEGVYARIKADLQNYVSGMEAKIKALEAKIDAQVAADAKKVTVVVDPLVALLSTADSAAPAVPPVRSLLPPA